MKTLRAICLAAIILLAAAHPAAAHNPPHWAGFPISIEPLPPTLHLPNSARAHRITYTSTSFTNLPTLITGAIFIPTGTTPPTGWPIVAWAHGTVGVADRCAPSTNGRSQRDIDYLQAWLAAGFAVVATDYEGLGTPGPHPYLNGISEAQAVIDILRASRRAEPSLATRWLAVGQSQGAQASMFTAARVGDYAPGLDFRGAIATGMPSQWRTTAEAAHAFEPAAPAIPEVIFILAGLRATHPFTVHANDYLTPLGRELLAATRTEACYTTIAQRMAGKTVADVFDIDPTEQETLLRLLNTDAEIPIERYDGPVFIAQGTADRTAYPPASQATAQLLHDAGSDVTFRFYPGADHNTTLRAALPDLLAWAADRVR